MTVAQVIAELSKYPAHLPVVGAYTTIWVGPEEDETETVQREVAEVVWQGRVVELDCSGAAQS